MTERKGLMNVCYTAINYFLAINNFVCFLQVNGVDVSSCSHDEAVKILSQASEPIIVEVKHRNNPDTGTTNPSDIVKVPSDSNSVNKGLKLSSKCSRDTQTDTQELGCNSCETCGDFYSSYYNFNCDFASLEPEENFIYPELQYEVKYFLV